jgi:hypothetical protein
MLSRILTFLVFSSLFLSCTRKQDGDRGFIFYSTRYIGKETCKENSQDNYHLLQVISPQNTGDSVFWQGGYYQNIVKARGVDSAFQETGKMIGFGAIISKERVSTSSCEVSPSMTFELYEIQILQQFPFR